MILTVEDSDLEQLKDVFPDLDFTDGERRAVLKAMDLLEVQAAPGSGKTTLLAAKLALIASKWPHVRRGICVLTHTNVAVDEIQRKLQHSPHGTRILNYPHFVGTIQMFVHTFLALPLLRSRGVCPDAIDDEHFAQQALRSAQKDFTLKAWLDKAPRKVAPIIEGLRFEGPGLLIGSAGGDMPNTDSKSFPKLQEIKKRLSSRGVFRYDDMFALAEHLLKKQPGLGTVLSYRFPMVFLDEMQDTSSFQESFLEQVFDASVVVQRLGDINQRIITDSRSGGPGSFPRSGFVSVSTSKRLAQSVANIANRLKTSGADMVGHSHTTIAPPTMFLYDDQSIHKVIPVFAAHAAKHFSAEGLQAGPIKAVCARKQGESKQGIGRSILDYWPAYSSVPSNMGSANRGLLSVVRGLRAHLTDGVSLLPAVDLARGAVLRLLQASGNPQAKSCRTWWDLMKALDSTDDQALLMALVRNLIVSPPKVGTHSEWKASVGELYVGIGPLLPKTLTVSKFVDLEYLEYDQSSPAPAVGQTAPDANKYSAVVSGKLVTVGIGTIASVKGETHLATLVLESFQQRTFDIQAALPFLTGNEDSTTAASPLLIGQLRNLFVAVTRPTHMLCLAMHHQRATETDKTALIAGGWEIHNC